ncbi:putative protease [Sporomusaceae bacterium BoRhaA]|uniref:DUF3656 domain-containing U32 family peptidase n=1 Tax=Pelorhabdus rhamnosifermentans TaxID=2772457 RepID=UPI001C06171B|nr:DUF3656 domain-containing protein [Pelorhabdus rhamnosifermentans]MBU2701560.1 putative protease [Pelorhabdus rhamnosifermentans]
MTELLAPVGNWEALVAAVESGAQAVYLGGKAFGARHYAANFDDKELSEAVRYAHLRKVLIYVTVNILIDTAELEELASYLRRLYTIGVDAILVQDIAVAKIAKQVVPDLPLHASTQMTIHNLAGVNYLASLGFCRVVLAREVSLDDIRTICKHSSVEIEVFIHGALCVSYSGQCLMSSLIGGRSGNRGKCAQPCRLPYELVDGKGNNVLMGKDAGEYLLSPKDLNTLELLPELVNAGVTSFKIEGRMKRPEYVAVVVDSYRRALNSVLASGQTNADDTVQKDLAQVFNRDFTTAYLQGKQGRAMMSDRRPNNRGTKLGRVLSYDRTNKQATIQLDEELAIGDIVEVWVKVGGRVNITVHDLIVNGEDVQTAPAGAMATVNVPSLVRASDRVFKTFDAKLMARARSFFSHQESLKRVGVYAEVTGKIGEALSITLTDEDGYVGTAQTNFICEQARNRPLTEATLRKQVERLGTTGFLLLGLVCHIEGELMVPVSEINEARRQAVEALEEARLSPFRRPAASQEPIAIKSLFLPSLPLKQKRPQLVVNVDRLDKVRAALEAGADGILLGGECYGHYNLTADDYQEALKLVHKAGRSIIFNTPRLVKEWQIPALLAQLKLFNDLQPDAVAIGNVGTLYLLKKHTDLAFQGDYPLNTFNKVALDFWTEQGATSVTLSPELNFSQIERLAAVKSVPIECLVHGHITMMVSEYCAVGSYLGGLTSGRKCSQACLKGQYYLKDRLNTRFPVVTDQYCRMHILNANELSMIPHVPRFGEIGVDRLRIEAKYMDVKAVNKMTQLYRQLIDQGDGHQAFASGQFESLEAANITRGHYFRGVL